MKTNHRALCIAAVVLLLIGCSEKPESEMGEKGASPAVPAVVEPAPSTDSGAVPPTAVGPGETMNEPETGSLGTEPSPEGGAMEDANSEEQGGMDASEEGQDNADPMLTPAPSPAPEPVE
ncbi:MAG: hypothetical protein ACRERU_04320 [Methylococcales bacterium]